MTLKELKLNLNKKVIHKSEYGESEYILTACVLRKREKTGELYCTAELQDITSSTKSLLYCNLNTIREIKEE